MVAVLLTGMPLDGHIDRSRRAGFAQMMKKPVNPGGFALPAVSGTTT
jgi:hypothetical protein